MDDNRTKADPRKEAYWAKRAEDRKLQRVRKSTLTFRVLKSLRSVLGIGASNPRGSGVGNGRRDPSRRAAFTKAYKDNPLNRISGTELHKLQRKHAAKKGWGAMQEDAHKILEQRGTS